MKPAFIIETPVSLRIARMLKQAGFDYYTSLYYYVPVNEDKAEVSFYEEIPFANWNNANDADNEYVSAPTLELVKKWLRDTKGIDIVVKPFSSNSTKDVGWNRAYMVEYYLDNGSFDGYSDAYESYDAALEYAIEDVLKRNVLRIENKWF